MVSFANRRSFKSYVDSAPFLGVPYLFGPPKTNQDFRNVYPQKKIQPVPPVPPCTHLRYIMSHSCHQDSGGEKSALPQY